MASELKIQIETDLNLSVSVSEFFQGISTAQLITKLLEQLEETVPLSQPGLPLQSVSPQTTLPLSFAQERFWFLQHLKPNSPAYNIPVTVQLVGNVDEWALRQAINAVIQRHEILRTSFPVVSGQPFQKVASSLTLPLSVLDLSGMTASEQTTQIQKLTLQNAQHIFDLTEGPLLKAMLLRLGDKSHQLILVLHHIIADGWSVGLMIKEIATFYAAFTKQDSARLPDLPIQYADYAYLQRQWMQGERLSRYLSHWKAKFVNSPTMLELPTDYPRPSVQTFLGTTHAILLPPLLTEGLKTLSRQQGATLFMTLLAILKTFLFKWTRQNDMVIGTVIANRDRREVQGLIGCFINFLPIRSKISESDSFLDVLNKLKKQVIDIYEFSSCPFQKLVEVINPDRRTTSNPLYNVAFLLQNFPQLKEFSETFSDLMWLDTGSSLLDMRFIATEMPSGISLTCEYSAELFTANTIEQLLSAYYDLSTQLVQQPQTRLSDIDFGEELQARVKAAKMDEQKQKIAITATFTAEPIKEALAFWLEELGIAATIEFGPYNQVFQQLLEPDSLLAENKDGINVILVQFSDWQRFTQDGDLREETIKQNVYDLVRAL
jgi:hypothetical protein